MEGNDINDGPFANGVGVSARITAAPWTRGDDAVHVGAAVAAAWDRRRPLSYAGGIGTDLIGTDIVATRDFGPRGRTRSAQAELAATIGRFSFQSEYTVLYVWILACRYLTHHHRYHIMGHRHNLPPPP